MVFVVKIAFDLMKFISGGIKFNQSSYLKSFPHIHIKINYEFWS